VAVEPEGSPPWEIETALLIRSERAAALAEEIAGLRSLGAYRLVPRPVETIRDRYLDTAQGALGARTIALRLRTLDGRQLLTLKTAAQRTDWGAARRRELEGPWSDEVLAQALQELRDSGVDLPTQAPAADRGSPLEVLAALGLEVVHDRETVRRPRDVVAEGSQAAVLAELAIDDARYRLGSLLARLFEVEIEAKAADGPATVRELTARLSELYPELTAWPHSKLATGRALERLVGAEGPDNLVGADGVLTPQAYDRILGQL
jgi:inorganic triphosphatase YgiF